MQEVGILLITNLDDDDFRAVVDSIKLRSRLLVVCDRSSILGYPQRDFSHMIDNFTDSQRLVERIRKWRKKNNKRIAGIIGLDEEYHYAFSKAVAASFGLAYHDRRTTDLCSNKYLQRLALFRAGVQVPGFEAIEGPSTSISYPNVLKLVTGYASQYVFLNRSEAEFRKHYRALERVKNSRKKDPTLVAHSSRFGVINPRKQYLVEEFMDGEEYSCDYLVGPRIRILRIVRKYSTAFGYFDAFYLFRNERIAGFPVQKLRQTLRRTADALGIRHGVCMMDFKVRAGGICVIETTVRPGISTFVTLMARVWGTTSIDVSFGRMLGRPQEPVARKSGLVVYIQVPSLGRITEFDTSYFEENWHALGVLEICKYLRAGQAVQSHHERLHSGYIMFEQIPAKRIAEIISLVREKCRIRVEK